MVSGIKSFQLKKQVVLGANRGIFTRRSKDDAGSLECVCPKDQRMVSITWHSVGTVHVTNVEETINKHKYIGILENKLWPVSTKISCFKITKSLYTELEMMKVIRLGIILIPSAGQQSPLV